MIYAVLETFNERNQGGFREGKKKSDSKLNITASTAFQNSTPDPLGRVNILMCM